MTKGDKWKSLGGVNIVDFMGSLVWEKWKQEDQVRGGRGDGVEGGNTGSDRWN